MRKPVIFALAWIATTALVAAPIYAQDRAANAQVEKPAAQPADATAPARNANVAVPMGSPARPFAAPEVADSAPVGGATGLGQVTLSLAIVLGAIFAVAWLARRMRTFGRGPGAVMDVIAEIQLGPKERAVLLRVGTKQILVGVATGGVTPLHVLDTPIEIPAPTATSPIARANFKDLLMRSLGKAP